MTKYVKNWKEVVEQVCEAPTSFNLLDPTPSTVTFDWNDVTNAAGYFFRERAVGANTWITADVIVSETANLMTHTSNTTYEWQVRTDCGNGNVSGWSALQTYTSPMADCEALSSTDLNTIISTNNGLEVTLEWMSMPNAQAYQLEGRKVNGNLKLFPQTNSTSRTFTSGILYNKSYEWHVRVKCDGVWTDYALPPASFTTPAGKNNANTFDIFATETEEATPFATKMYPNPAKDLLNIEHLSFDTAEKVNFTISDIAGRQVMQGSLQNGTNEIDISAWNEGIYFVQIASQYHTATQKIIVAR